MKVIIRNWQKINARKDVHNPSWFKFKHKFFYDADFYDFNHSEIVTWIYLLCEASIQNKNGEIKVNPDHAGRVLGINAQTLENVVKKLESLHIVDVDTSRERYADVRDPGARLDKIREENTRSSEVENAKQPRKDHSTRVTGVNPRGAIACFESKPLLVEILKATTRRVQNAWVDAYGDPEWIGQEIGLARAWVAANPRRAPKDFGRFMTNWLSRAYEKRRKQLPSTTQSPVISRDDQESIDRNQSMIQQRLSKILLEQNDDGLQSS